jgi:MerR family transcriptional regulator/heat shock protein HspR
VTDKGKPVYMIGVVAEMLRLHPQTLRMYEKKGLIRPSRTEGRTRMYSSEDVEEIARVVRLARDRAASEIAVAERFRTESEAADREATKGRRQAETNKARRAVELEAEQAAKRAAIESGKYRLNKRIMEHLHDRLPGGDVWICEFSREIDLGCDLLGAGILEEMRGTANH